MKRTVVEVTPPKWQWRMVVSVVMLLAGMACSKAYHIAQGPFEGQAVVDSINGESEDTLLQAIALSTTDVRYYIMAAVVFVLVAFVWLPFALKMHRYQNFDVADEAAPTKETATPASDETNC